MWSIFTGSACLLIDKLVKGGPTPACFPRLNCIGTTELSVIKQAIYLMLSVILTGLSSIYVTSRLFKTAHKTSFTGQYLTNVHDN